MKLNGKITMVVGGASGMGKAVVKLFAQEGATVILADINEEAAKVMAEEINAEDANVTTVYLNVTDQENVKKAFENIKEQFGRLDILVNCVGLAHFAPINEIELEKWYQIIDVNLTGPFLCCKEAAAIMKEAGNGKIVNFGSTGGLFGIPDMSHYSAAKHGVVGLTKSLAVELGKYGINVNCVCPGATQTDMLLSTTTEEYRRDRSKRIPLQRLALPEDQANAVLFLCCDESDYINGASICVDGGVSVLSPGTKTEAVACMD